MAGSETASHLATSSLALGQAGRPEAGAKAASGVPSAWIEALQATAGNNATSGVIQRLRGTPSAHAPRDAPTVQRQGDRDWRSGFTVFGMEFEVWGSSPVHNMMVALQYSERRIREIREELEGRDWLVGGISSLVAGGSFVPPGLDELGAAEREIEAARDDVNVRFGLSPEYELRNATSLPAEIKHVIDSIHRAQELAQQAKRRFDRWARRSVEGAQTSAEVLEVIRNVSFTIVTAYATRGASAALGVTTLGARAAVGAGVAGGVSAVGSLATEVGEEAAGINPGFDEERFFRDLGIAGLAGFLSSLTGAALERVFARLFFGPPNARLAEELARQFSVFGLRPPYELGVGVVRRIASRTIETIPQTLLAEAARSAGQELSESEAVTLDGFMQRFVENLYERGAARIAAQVAMVILGASPQISDL